MNPIEAHGITQRFRTRMVLRDIDLSIPPGAMYALLGRNASGKTTLFHILLGLRHATSGASSILGVRSTRLGVRERERIGYVAEGQALPQWMTLEQLENFVRPLYPTWDEQLASSLRRRFELRSDSKIKTMSRGEQMKAAMLCALAPRPQVLIMDEPFTGMDVVVKDELVGGLLDSARSEGWTVVISSHDISELELLVDHVGILRDGKLVMSSATEEMARMFRHVEIRLPDASSSVDAPPSVGVVMRAGSRMELTTRDGEELRRFLANLPAEAIVDERGASLKEVFVATTGRAETEGVAA